jgi:hypothetical protein
MSIEDINYLRNNSIKQNYTFLIDSVDRDRSRYPNPNKYTIDFTVPFKNVIGMEIIDSSIPRTMYNIDYENNELYYYIGKNTSDINIVEGIKEELNSTDLTKDCSFNSGYAVIGTDNYLELTNNIHLYNIYNTGGIGGKDMGISFSFKTKVLRDNNAGATGDKKYYIFNFGYYHLHLNTFQRDKYSGILVYIKKNIDNSYDMYFTIGYEDESPDSTYIINNINLSVENHVCWTISSDNKWTINISTKTEKYEKANNRPINNVFYTEKNIGRKFISTFYDATKLTKITYINGWDDTIKLYIKDFKIYNKVLDDNEIVLCRTNTIELSNLPIWYKLYSYSNEDSISNSGLTKFINYKDMFGKLHIKEGDYTLKTLLFYFDRYDEYEIGIKKHSEPAEMSNLIDIYCRHPFILDMQRSTIYENLGFDLLANSIPEHINIRYEYKDVYNSNSLMSKMFHSVKNLDNIKIIPSKGIFDMYKITPPGVIYLIGNKYILLRCPEIEEHIFGSLSYTKYSLGLAKFRIDNIGINTERLVITKLPIREFHPIGKLSRLSLRFETNKGTLYDFKGVNHNIIFAIYYYEPTQKKLPQNSILNPEYKMNYMEYKYYEEEIEGDSEEDEDEEDYSRDNIDTYLIKENEYSNEGIQLKKYEEYRKNDDE